MIKLVKGNLLKPEVQQEALRLFVMRYTMEHIPIWAKHDCTYPVQFASDADWLANTEFAVKKDGTLDKRTHHCWSYPTWAERMILP